jgi:hypothetical protein
MNRHHKFDIYKSKSNSKQRLVTLAGAGLPQSPIGANDWVKVKNDNYEPDEYAVEDIEDHGFYFVELIDLNK